ncbi:MAG TPA: hypothetical protein PKW95_02885 [bacterium]|nr:hypothetical protein [bacterium]
MGHVCDAAVVTCEDFRLHQRADGSNFIAEFIKSLKVDCDLITRGGSVQDLLRPKMPGFDQALFRDLTVSVELHQVKTIYLINHEDCGAYGAMQFADREAETAQHHQDLREARNLLMTKFPEVEIVLYFAELKTEAPGRFRLTEVH